MYSKIVFSTDELSVLSETEFFRHKRAVTEKIYQFYADIIAQIKTIHATNTYVFPPGTDLISGKISKGENYKGFPYYVLDFPRLFSHDNIFSFRVMLWWGHYWSLHLHLRGAVLQQFGWKIANHIRVLPPKKYWISCYGQEWNYDFSDATMLPLQNISVTELDKILAHPVFLKLSAKKDISSRMPYEWIIKNYLTMMRSFVAD